MITNFLNNSTKLFLTRAIIPAIFFLGLFSQTQAQQKNDPDRRPGLVSFNSQLVTPQIAKAKFTDLGDREVVNMPELEFVAQEDIQLEFQVRVRPDGSVSYVRSPRCSPELNEYRKGGVYALYNSKFSPTETGQDQWIRVNYTFPGIN